MEPSDPSCDPSGNLEAWVIQTRLAQGLPARVEDPTVLARIVDLLGIGIHEVTNHAKSEEASE
jgi:hypothetical protein